MDIEKIKKGLECCYVTDLRECDDCPYGDLENCKHGQLMTDTIEYIKDLELKNRQLYNSGENKNTTCLGLMRDNERLSDIVHRQQGEVKAYKDVIDNFFKKGIVLCDGTNFDYPEDDDKKGCTGCLKKTIENFAKWLTKRSNNLIYIDLAKKYIKECL